MSDAVLVAGMLTAIELPPKQSFAALQRLALKPSAFSGHPWVRALSRTLAWRMNSRVKAQKHFAIPAFPWLTARDGVTAGFLAHIDSTRPGPWLVLGRLVALEGFGGPLCLLSCGHGRLPPVTGEGPWFEAQMG